MQASVIASHGIAAKVRGIASVICPTRLGKYLRQAS
jgi:hypothetical protein